MPTVQPTVIPLMDDPYQAMPFYEDVPTNQPTATSFIFMATTRPTSVLFGNEITVEPTATRPSKKTTIKPTLTGTPSFTVLANIPSRTNPTGSKKLSQLPIYVWIVLGVVGGLLILCCGYFAYYRRFPCCMLTPNSIKTPLILNVK